MKRRQVGGSAMSLAVVEHVHGPPGARVVHGGCEHVKIGLEWAEPTVWV
jgi:hypothetical protein